FEAKGRKRETDEAEGPVAQAPVQGAELDDVQSGRSAQGGDEANGGTSVHMREADGADFFASDDERAVMRLIVAEAKRRLSAGEFVAAYDWDGIVNAVAGRLGYSEWIDVRGLVERSCVEPYIGLHPYAREIL